ncbi:MAG: type IV secretion system DNA-binding domain-containing protein [Rhodocyclaceae bacterium]|nr:MAG: type IV secretion system DNA-binding domain-containing protein [Rhodocyclaceae bacterium]CAG0926964.1 Coupling protein TraD [Rhodocyclaceae bacterium]
MHQPSRTPALAVISLLSGVVMFVFATLAGWTVLGVAQGQGVRAGVEVAKADLFSKLPLVGERLPIGAGFVAWRQRQPEGAPVSWLEKIRIVLSILAAAGAVIVIKRDPSAGADHHIRGRRYIEGKAALSAFTAASRREVEDEGEGIRLHPSLPPISIKREARHFLVFGGVGSGKTQTILPMMLAAQRRGDALFVYDNKGDFTAKLPDMPGVFKDKTGRVVRRTIEPVILAPWDVRSAVWDISADVNDKAAAREFAAAIVPESKSSPMWSSAARQVLTGCLIELQQTKPGAWGFRDLAGLCFRGAIEEYQETMKRYFPEGLMAVSASNVTSLGILINMQAFLSPVADLADAWPERPSPDRRFSLRHWLELERPIRRVVVVQGNGRFEQLAQGFAKSLFTLAAQTITDPAAVGESRSRRLWVFLDEFPQMGEMSRVAPMLEVGRSKGVRVVLGVQDIAQLKHVYGAERASAWQSLVANQIVCQLQPGATSKFVAEEIIGDREIERIAVSSSTGGGTAAGIFSPGGTQTSNIVRESRPVMLPSELQSKLGPRKKGVAVLWLGYSDALNITIPYTSVPDAREAVRLAGWCRGSNSTLEQVAELIQHLEEEQKRPQESALATAATALYQPAVTHAASSADADILALIDGHLENSDRDDDEEGEQAGAIPASAAALSAPATEPGSLETQILDVAPIEEPEPESVEPEPTQDEEIKGRVVEEVAKETGEAALDAILPGLGRAYEVTTAFAEAAEGVTPAEGAGDLPEAPSQQKRIKIRRKQRIENSPEASC